MRVGGGERVGKRGERRHGRRKRGRVEDEGRDGNMAGTKKGTTIVR